MHPSAFTQRQNAAYARIQAAGEYIAQDQGWPEDVRPNLSTVSHADANMRALLKLEATADLVVRIAQNSGFEELAPEEFKPNEFVASDQDQPPASAAVEAQPQPAGDEVADHAARRASHGAKRK